MSAKKITSKYVKKSISRLAILLLIDGIVAIIITVLVTLGAMFFAALGAAIGGNRISGEFFVEAFFSCCIALVFVIFGNAEIYRSFKIRRNQKLANEIVKTFVSSKRIAPSRKTEDAIR